MTSSNLSKESILPIFIADAFTNRAFSGNGAAVCLLSYQQVVPDDIKQKIAAEMNLSETAFISILEENDTFENGKRFALRWFTPTCEVQLCGHATLASATVLFSAFKNPSPVLEFETLSGTLRVKWLGDGQVEMDLPAFESKRVEDKSFEAVVKAAVGTLPIEEVVLSQSDKLLVRLKDHLTRRQLEELRPRSADLMAAAPDVVGLIVTLRGSGLDDCSDEEGRSYDFVSRYFAPWLGVPEDPVTGSAHCVLAPYWSKVLNKEELYARQCSTRGGNVKMRLAARDRVAVGGGGVLVLQGQIRY